MNRVEPTRGNVTEEKDSELNTYIKNAKTVMCMLGYKTFGIYQEEREIYYIKTCGADASCIHTSLGYKILEGSTIRRDTTKSCPKGLLQRREAKSKYIDENYKLTRTIVVNSGSRAVSFVLDGSRNMSEWKTEDGRVMRPEK